MPIPQHQLPKEKERASQKEIKEKGQMAIVAQACDYSNREDLEFKTILHYSLC